MPKKQKKFADDGWAIWVDGDDLSTVYINNWLNPKGKSYVDLAIRIRGVKSVRSLNVYVPFVVTEDEIEDVSLLFKDTRILQATFSAVCIVDYMKNEHTSEIAYNGKEYVFIDTAGLRRKNKIKEEIERYSIIRAVTAVERADVCIIMIDATEGVTEQDAKIAGIAHERGKGIIVAVNKWDAIEKDDKTIYRHTEKIRDILSFMPYAEIIFISVKSGQRINKIFETIDVVLENNSMRVGTGVLNEIVTEAVAMQQPPSDKGKRLRIYYTTQVSVKPPTFVIFVNDKELMHFSYTRYLENRIRDTFGFKGTALKFIMLKKMVVPQ